MAAAVAITRMDLTAARLRAGAAREKDSAAARRMLAIALILEGVDRATAARSCGMDRQTLRDWVHRWNAEGLEGLRDRKGLGAVPKLSAQQLAEFSAMVEDGPDQAVHKVVRWRQRDLCDELKRRFGVEIHERTVGKYLAKLGYRRLSVRPQHPKSDPETQEAFKKTSARLSLRPFRSMPGTSRLKSGSRTKPASASKAR